MRRAACLVLVSVLVGCVTLLSPTAQAHCPSPDHNVCVETPRLYLVDGLVRDGGHIVACAGPDCPP